MSIDDDSKFNSIELEKSRRWRLILGKDSETEKSLKEGRVEQGCTLNEQDRQRDSALDYLYRREYGGRGHTDNMDRDNENRHGSLDPTSITPTTWLSGVRKVFPKSTVEVLQKQAIDRYDLVSLLSDKQVLKQSTPSMDLVQTLLSFKNHLSADVMGEVRKIIRSVCDELEEKLSQKVLSQFTSRRIRHLHGGRKQMSSLDWAASIRRNLKNYVEDEDALILENLYFYMRQENRIPWQFYIVIDQSGSMLGSLIYSAVLAAIFCRLKSIDTHLILFDTSVVDLSGQIDDPVDTLLSVQLGGGTDIGSAMTYTANKISQPQKSIVVLISDFYEGAPPHVLYSQVKRLKDSGVQLLGLASLDRSCTPDYCEYTARNLNNLGMPIASMTPEHLASWVAESLR